ncbi:MAG: type II toxin-antitoxin system RelE/ParE family toxin [Prosthecobacter sp.]|jgi:mRNA-degrading endonuclease RelE of RelBE toxin-antitoxin system|uniref:type II toxin-antitoxin system RelE family toxin n=1 Tax=Prosthecobacter sp. TaxID=1965333 RepID=UPI0019E8B284|nr:type II toxin-antitoxin system RelE/ParE family toxin [Prosthecobacter sp.]MBE2284710.1 type II toxin-antitoxin system RelE/ParE family toxin [Prosthecobacter sp.]
MPFKLIYDKEARDDLKELKPHEAVTILKTIELQLSHHPAAETNSRKLLRPNPFFTWELRIQPFRVFYQVDEASEEVRIQRIGCKIHNDVYLRGEKIEL